MPWLETALMEQRERFIRDHQLALYNMADLSARYGISRKTGYKWLERFDQGGRNGIRDLSQAPRRWPHKISDAVATLICDARRGHPSWGPKKLLEWPRSALPQGRVSGRSAPRAICSRGTG
jgi:transposase